MHVDYENECDPAKPFRNTPFSVRVTSGGVSLPSVEDEAVPFGEVEATRFEFPLPGSTGR